MEYRLSSSKKVPESYKVRNTIQNNYEGRDSLTVSELQSRLRAKQQRTLNVMFGSTVADGLNALKKPIVDRFHYATTIDYQQKLGAGRLLTEIIPHVSRSSKNHQILKCGLGFRSSQRNFTQTDPRESKWSPLSRHEFLLTEPNKETNNKPTISKNKPHKILQQMSQLKSKPKQNFRGHGQRGTRLAKQPRNTIGDMRNLSSSTPIKPQRNKTIRGLSSSIIEQSDDVSISGFSNQSVDDIKENNDIEKMGSNLTRMSTNMNSQMPSYNNIIDSRIYNQSAKKYSSVKPFRSSNLTKFDLTTIKKAKQEIDKELRQKQKPEETETAKQAYIEQVSSNIKPTQLINRPIIELSSARNHHRRKGFGLSPKQSIFRQLNVDEIINEQSLKTSLGVRQQEKHRTTKVCRESIEVVCNIIEAISQDRPDVLKFIISIDDTHQERLKKLEQVRILLESEYRGDPETIKVINLIESYATKWKRTFKENLDVNRQKDEAIIFEMLDGIQGYADDILRVDPCIPLKRKSHGVKNAQYDDVQTLLQKRHSRLANVIFQIDWKQEKAKHYYPQRTPLGGNSVDHILNQYTVCQTSKLQFINNSNNCTFVSKPHIKKSKKRPKNADY